MREIIALLLLWYLVGCGAVSPSSVPLAWYGDCKTYDMPQPLASGKVCTTTGTFIAAPKAMIAKDVRLLEDGCGEAYSLWYVSQASGTFDVVDCATKAVITDWTGKNPDLQLLVGVEHSPPIPLTSSTSSASPPVN